MNAKIFQALFYGVRVFNPDIKVSATVPLAQAIHESKNWTSNIYTTTNNMFGMMMPQVRQTTATAANPKGFAVYRSALDSIRDYFNWLRAFEITNDVQLVNYLKAGKYATDPKYFAAIQRTVASVSGDIISPVALGVGVVGGLGLTAAGFALIANKR